MRTVLIISLFSPFHPVCLRTPLTVSNDCPGLDGGVHLIPASSYTMLQNAPYYKLLQQSGAAAKDSGVEEGGVEN